MVFVITEKFLISLFVPLSFPVASYWPKVCLDVDVGRQPTGFGAVPWLNSTWKTRGQRKCIFEKLGVDATLQFSVPQMKVPISDITSHTKLWEV